MATITDLAREGSFLHQVDRGTYDQGRFLIQERCVEPKHVDEGEAVVYVFDDEGKYTVELWEHSGRLEANCNCPADDSGGFCAHEIAAALSL